MPDAPPTVTVSRRGADRVRAGHPWVYRSDVAASDAAPGDLVHVVGEHGRPIGWALWSSRSQIALRMLLGLHGGRPDERDVFRTRLASSIACRASLGIDATACRLVHGEADGLPGVVVDRYADWMVLQTLCQGADRRLPLITELLVELASPRGILARNDPKVRQLEGLGEQVEVVFGEVPDVVEVREGAIRRHVDLRHGQKTGAFLDQRENHAAAVRYARGRVLDGFAYQGGFALPMAARADQVLAIDSSAPAVAGLRAAAALNGVTNIDAREANVFDELRELEVAGVRFETIVLDPPAFAKNKAAVPRAVAGYKEINLRAVKLLAPGGHLITCSCSYNVDESLFLRIVEAAAADARTPMVLVEKRLQARDHPVLLGMPETYYLKCFVLRKPA